MIEPTIEALTTSWSPSFRAKKAMISSGALPKVTFSRPPMPGPVLAAMCSVASPITAAVGITPSAAAAKISTGAACGQLERDRDRDEDRRGRRPGARRRDYGPRAPPRRGTSSSAAVVVLVGLVVRVLDRIASRVWRPSPPW